MGPLNLGETIDASVKIVRARWKTLATVMLVIALPVQIADVVIIRATTDVYEAGTTFQDASANTTYSNEGAFVAGQVAILALGFLSYLLGTVACYRAVADTYLRRETSARASLEFAAGRLGATLWLTIVLVVGLVAAFLALILPGIWLAVAWCVAYPVMLVEGIGGVAALRRSYELTHGRWWATFGRLAVAYILVFVLSGIVAAVFVAPIADDTSFGALVLEHTGDFIVSLITTPFLAAVTTLVYFDLRLRKEGVDPARLGDGPVPERDAFGHPVAPAPQAERAEPPPLWAPPSPSAAPPPAAAPGSGWAPPVAPEPRRPDDG